VRNLGIAFAQHVAHVGKAGWKDWNVVQRARAVHAPTQRTPNLGACFPGVPSYDGRVFRYAGKRPAAR
jgi:hypothetical protein